MAKQTKTEQTRELRLRLLKEQGNICPLCEQVISVKQATLDHCHSSGHVRAVLHRNCNHIEGRIKSWVKRSGEDPITFLLGVVRLWEGDHSANPIYPHHKNEIEKEISRLRKRMKRLQSERGKQKYRDKIKELQGDL